MTSFLPIRNSRMTLSSGQLFWREVGHGRAIVFLHGNWQGSDQWAAILSTLAQHHHCLAPDLLGFGESDRPQRLRYSIAVEVTCLAEFLKTLNLRHVYLVGHSLGAWVATRYALTYPDQVQGLVLIAPEGVPSPIKNRWRTDRGLIGPMPFLHWFSSLLYPLAKMLNCHGGLKMLQARRQQLRRSLAACQILFQRRPREIEAEYVQPQLAQLACPVLLVQGGQDVKTTHSMSSVYSSLIPQITTQHILQSSSVDLPEVAPEALAREIHLFIKSITGVG